MSEYCYVTRDTSSDGIEVWPANVGVRKFHGCVIWGAAWKASASTGQLCGRNYNIYAERLNKIECRKRFGFVPRPGTAWDIDGKKRTQVHLDFSD